MIADTCTGYDVKSGTPCFRDPVDAIAAGCVHEHVGTRSLCQFHIADLAEGRMWCGDCQQGSDPHRCELVTITRPVVAARGGR